MSGPRVNTDREIWRGPDDGRGGFYADSLHITAEGALGINVGGHVIVKPVREWRRLAAERDAYKAAFNLKCAELASARKALEDCRTSYCGYAITKSEQYPGVIASFFRELERIDKVARTALATAQTEDGELPKVSTMSQHGS